MTMTEFLLARIAEDEELMREDFLPLHPWFAVRILGAFKAKRKIVEEAQRVAVATHQEMGSLSDLADHVLTHLALPYADHPDYREEWKP